MQFVAINWHIYLLTKSAFALGLVGLFRGVPIIVCSLAGGVVADAFDRKRTMVVTQTVMLLTAALLTTATLSGLKSVWPIYMLSALSAAAQAFDTPARQALTTPCALYYLPTASETPSSDQQTTYQSLSAAVFCPSA